MGMNEPPVARGDEQVELARAGPGEQHIAGVDCVIVDQRKLAVACNVLEPRNITRPQGVAARERCFASDRGKRCGQYADTVQPGPGIPAVEPKSRPDQLFGGCRQCVPAHTLGAG